MQQEPDRTELRILDARFLRPLQRPSRRASHLNALADRYRGAEIQRFFAVRNPASLELFASEVPTSSHPYFVIENR